MSDNDINDDQMEDTTLPTDVPCTVETGEGSETNEAEGEDDWVIN